MRRNVLQAAAAALVIGLTGLSVHAVAATRSSPVDGAVADTARPDADRERDANRKPAESLTFAGVKGGQKVAELLPGSGYFTRLFSVIVGPKGHVYALSPQGRPGGPDMGAAVAKIAADPHYSNVSTGTMSVQELKLPEPVDMVWTSQNYHDLHNIPDSDLVAFDKAVFNVLKPGGIFIVLDHAAEAGSGFRDTKTLHRVDPEAVKKEALAAGFTFVAESDVLHNSDDTHSVNVHDAAIRGKTDQFILKFRKPG
jgi:predicted methyltransferase